MRKNRGNDLLLTWTAQHIKIFYIFVCVSYYKSGFEFHVADDSFLHNTSTNKLTKYLINQLTN